MKLTKVLITGAGGFLGSYIARDLFLDGEFEIYSFSRSHHKILEQYNVKQILGNLSNKQEVLNALSGMDAVIHTASLVGMWGRYEDFFETNVIGTNNIIEACLYHKIKKCVYTSTPSVAFGSLDLLGVDESTPYPKKYYSFYAETKAIAEKNILNANSPEFSTVALRPHLIFGPGDQNLVPRVIKAAKMKRLKIIGDGLNLVDVTYVENASFIHLKALKDLSPTSKIAGRAYFVGQGPIKLWDFTNEILRRSGLGPVTKHISFKKAYALGFIIENVLGLFKLYRADPPMTRFVAMQLGLNHYYNHHNLEIDLGYKPQFSIEEGLDRLFASMK